MTDMMKAVRISNYGGPEVLTYQDYPQPEICEDGVKVRVLASSLSGFDVKYRKGALQHVKLPGRRSFPMPMQLGRDTAGIVVEVGKRVSAFQSGDRVVGLVSPINPLSTLSNMGLGNLSMDLDLPGHTMFGSNAQFVSRPETYWLHLPDNVSMVDAAACMWSYATCHRMLTERLKMQVGETLFVVGGSGGMGSAALDLARLMGLHVITTSRSADKNAYLRDRGADEIIMLNGGSDHPADVIRGKAGDLGVDGAIDFSGKPEMLRLCVDVLRPGGRLVPLAGEESPDPMPITVADCVKLELNVLGGRGSNISDQRSVLQMLSQKQIRPAIAKVMNLSEARTAHEELEGAEPSGRIILTPWDDAEG